MPLGESCAHSGKKMAFGLVIVNEIERVLQVCISVLCTDLIWRPDSSSYPVPGPRGCLKFQFLRVRRSQGQDWRPDPSGVTLSGDTKVAIHSR